MLEEFYIAVNLIKGYLKPFDLKLWSADDQLLKVVVERLGAV